MKKRLLIICSIIGVLLAGFRFPIYAETTPPDYSSSTAIVTNSPLDQYFYDNYELLPYIESDGSQYIDTGINGSNNLRFSLVFGGLDINNTSTLFGSRTTESTNKLYLAFYNSNKYAFHFDVGSKSFSIISSDYNINSFVFDQNKIYFNNSLINEFEDNSFSGPSLYLFGLNNGGSLQPFSSSIYKLYNCSIYDYAANEGKGALVRDYYPARAKSSGIIGLYDAVSKTFITTSGSVPFDSPTGDPVNLSLGANITQFLSGSLSWIGAIFEGINEMPIIWVFIAIALAGVAFRWARRIVHF